MLTEPPLTTLLIRPLVVYLSKLRFLIQIFFPSMADLSLPSPIVNTLAFTVDMGTVTSETSDPLVFALGVVRDPAIHYTDGNSVTEARSPYYWSNFSSTQDVVCALQFFKQIQTY